MVELLTYLGLAILPFIILPGYEPRQPKEIVALLLALAIAVFALYKGQIKNVKNFWVYLIPTVVAFSTFFAMHSNLFIGFFNGKVFVPSAAPGSDNLWNYKAAVYLLIYFLCFLAIASSRLNIDKVMRITYICGVLTALYCIMQAFGMDQFLMIKPRSLIGSVKAAEVTGMIGQPTHVGAFLAITLPATIYCRRFLFACVIFLAIILSQSAFAIATASLVSLLSLVGNNRKLAVSILSIFVIVIPIFYYFHPLIDNGRFNIWQSMWTDFKSSHQVVTGLGTGAFSFIFPSMHNSAFRQAHNEYFEFVYNCGFIGAIVMLGFFYEFFKSAYRLFNHEKLRCLSYMMLASCLVSLGTFTWQLGTTAFYTIVTLGAFYNEQLA